MANVLKQDPESFSDQDKARQTFSETFEKLQLINTIAAIDSYVDHILLSRDFIKNKKATTESWNEIKVISDHLGICLTLLE